MREGCCSNDGYRKAKGVYVLVLKNLPKDYQYFGNKLFKKRNEMCEKPSHLSLFRAFRLQRG